MSLGGVVQSSEHFELEERAARLRRISRAISHDLSTRPTDQAERTAALLRVVGYRIEADRLDAALVHLRGW